MRQDRDASRESAPAGQLAADCQELGQVLRKLRGRRSLRDLARQASISPASLSRYENGASISHDFAAVLDEILDAEGWVVASVARLRQPTWKPWTDDIPAASSLTGGRPPIAVRSGSAWWQHHSMPVNATRSG